MIKHLDTHLSRMKERYVFNKIKKKLRYFITKGNKNKTNQTKIQVTKIEHLRKTN